MSPPAGMVVASQEMIVDPALRAQMEAAMGQPPPPIFRTNQVLPQEFANQQPPMSPAEYARQNPNMRTSEGLQ